MRCPSCEPDYCACADFYAGRMLYWKGELMSEALTSAKLREIVMYDTKFQASCQRYAHNGGSSEAIAAAAVEVIVAAMKEEQ